ncbi:lipoprotein-releasing ABC transporter permease subunit [Gilvimarinus sp. DA14]|uniref:lipoprotein-releasing ABC transporter permease subunit n=1 Tax=Gilvimarinus sp. DA14 TaxID=2956798 RepID=UPI0020B854E6|nr:lipoprotein-releasing ABC transporter permease subunit [Gilvimarinus sp. DA14]UTF60921.1 lipoprotein-releasing ABC transporter permease subunit [Gilvimarinus sp. DA14]
MFSRFSRQVGKRYALAAKGSHLVSFISRMSVLGLIISVALLILVMSIMNGFDRELRERILQVMPQATIYKRDGITNPSEIISQLRQHPQVLSAAPYVNLQGLLSYRGEVSPVALFGIEPALEQEVSGASQYLRRGALDQLAKKPQAIILGAALAQSLKVDIGEHLRLIIPHGDGRASPAVQTLEVIDLLDSGTEIDNNFALLNLTLASELSDYPGRVSGIRLKVDDLFAASRTVYELAGLLPPGYYGKDWSRTHGNLYQAIHMSKRLVGLLLLLLIGIAAFNLVTTLIMVVVDKEADIAILRTQGASTGDILGIFLVQGGIIGLVGTAIGVAAGVLMSYTVTPAVALLERGLGVQFLHSDVYPVSYLPSQLLWADVGLIVVVALGLSFCASLYPAWRAARIPPAEALRFE